ncbi:alpha/beta hydrolase [Desulfuribacillus alkaliarsenatis]|uniref:AB hydrolase-1 domain-containing protein n=1 Tax=Desulfuribacillus alkaliarsenatis TaxID=766136 RepID=A0A1E5G444_9FIRM|nr:alpha/beta fold hydrolase [Desulfuribacillus alkaliarsenatis]OEF97856.1 hypothetical protein BHF68_13595 [Desulfuribacillus alkaliarsenatis]
MIEKRDKGAFYLEGSKEIGVLLTHGFTGSPAEVRPLGEFLNQQGYTVYAPLLAGHGTCVEDMEQTNWQDWWKSVELGYEKLKVEGCREIIACGLSMGGILSLKVAINYPLKAVISMCAPIYLSDRRAYFMSVLKYFRRFHKKSERYNGAPSREISGYLATPLACVPSLIELIKQVKPLLGHIEVPALIMQAEQDLTVRPASGSYIYEHIGSYRKQYITYEKSGHIITIDKEREKVFKDIHDFIKRLDQ